MMDEVKNKIPSATTQPGTEPGCGLLLPATAPRRRNIFRTVTGLTVFAFTMTSILPSGWAWPGSSASDQTLRGEQADEAVQQGLE